MKRILVADDVVDIRKLIRVSVGGAYEVVEAENGVRALQLIREYRPSLVLLDIMMPGEVDGLQVLDVIRSDARLKHIPVILVTARGQATDCDLGMSRGADAYFIKPFSPGLLLTSIEALTQTNRDERPVSVPAPLFAPI